MVFPTPYVYALAAPFSLSGSNPVKSLNRFSYTAIRN
jgi:hypothetical protein